MKRIILLLGVVLLIIGCGVAYDQIRKENRENLVKIEKGMTTSQVQQVMGEKSFGNISNPYKREIIRDRQGEEYEILYYYTEHIGSKNWEEGMTPIILKDGKVVGIGWRYLENSDFNSNITIKNR